MIGDPREKRSYAKPTEIDEIEPSLVQQEPEQETAVITRSKYDIETEVLALCLRVVRGEDVLDRLFEVLRERSLL
jgi:hypothetical protein